MHVCCSMHNLNLVIFNAKIPSCLRVDSDAVLMIDLPLSEEDGGLIDACLQFRVTRPANNLLPVQHIVDALVCGRVESQMVVHRRHQFSHIALQRSHAKL